MQKIVIVDRAQVCCQLVVHTNQKTRDGDVQLDEAVESPRALECNQSDIPNATGLALRDVIREHGFIVFKHR